MESRERLVNRARKAGLFMPLAEGIAWVRSEEPGAVPGWSDVNKDEAKKLKKVTPTEEQKQEKLERIRARIAKPNYVKSSPSLLGDLMMIRGLASSEAQVIATYGTKLSEIVVEIVKAGEREEARFRER